MTKVESELVAGSVDSGGTAHTGINMEGITVLIYYILELNMILKYGFIDSWNSKIHPLVMIFYIEQHC